MPPTATWVVDTGRPRADAPSTVTAVASDTQKARPAFSLVMPLPTMWTRRRPNSSVPVAMASPPPASTSTALFGPYQPRNQSLTSSRVAALRSFIEPITPRYDLYQTKSDWLNQKWTELIVG